MFPPLHCTISDSLLASVLITVRAGKTDNVGVGVVVFKAVRSPRAGNE